MDDLAALLRGSGPLGIEDACQALRVLVPVVNNAPSDEEAQAAIRHVCSRTDRSEPLTMLVDWWLDARTGCGSPVGLAFELDEGHQWIPPELRSVMRSARDQYFKVPVLQWLDADRTFDGLIEQLDDRLTLDYYGKSRLPSERKAWSALLDELDPVVSRLRDGEAVELPIEPDLRGYEATMVDGAIDENSRRWKEMLKRAGELVEFLNHLGETAAVVASRHDIEFTLLDDLPVFEDPAAREFAEAMLGPLAGRPAEGPITFDDLVDILDAAATGTDEAGKHWLAEVVDTWVRTTGRRIPAIDEVLQRAEDLTTRRDELDAAGVDVDEIDILLLDHELTAAEIALDRIERLVTDERDLNRFSDALDRLRARVEAHPELAEQVAEAEAARDQGDVDALRNAIGSLDREVQYAEREGTLDRLRAVAAEARRLAIDDEVLAELERRIAQLEADRSIPVRETEATAAEQRLADVVDALRFELREELAAAVSLVGRTGSTISDEVRQEATARLASVEASLADGPITDLRSEISAVIRDIDRSRVRRWSLDADGEPELVSHVLEVCRAAADFDPHDVRRSFVAIKTKPFVILAGLTGSGKSLLSRVLAESFGATTSNGRFRRIAVRPDWVDQAEVLGYVNPMTSMFEPGWLAETLRRCQAEPESLFFVLLDEMNLAPVEHYLADLLSAMEEARAGSSDVRIPLYAASRAPTNASDWPAELRFPENLVILGTVNVDESTRPLTQRVLDRANVIQLRLSTSARHHGEDLAEVPRWTVPAAEWHRLCRTALAPDHHEFLAEIADVLATIGIGVGMRAHVELERFVANADGVMDGVDALDFGVLQRIVPRIQGFKAQLISGLEQLEPLLESAGCHRSATVVHHWLSSDTPDDEFLDGADPRIGVITS